MTAGPTPYHRPFFLPPSTYAILSVMPLAHNWVVRIMAGELLPDQESLLAAIEDGRLAGLFLSMLRFESQVEELLDWRT